MGTAGRPREIGSVSDRAEEMIGTAISPKWQWGPPGILFNQYLRPIFPRGKLSSHEADHSPALAPGLQNEWSCTFTPTYAFMACTEITLLFLSSWLGVSVSSSLQNSKSRLLISLYLSTQFMSVLLFGATRNCEIVLKRCLIQCKVGAVLDPYGPKLSLNHNF